MFLPNNLSARVVNKMLYRIYVRRDTSFSFLTFFYIRQKETKTYLAKRNRACFFPLRIGADFRDE